MERRWSVGLSRVPGRAPGQQSSQGMDAWQKWTPVVNLGAQHAGGGRGGEHAGVKRFGFSVQRTVHYNDDLTR